MTVAAARHIAKTRWLLAAAGLILLALAAAKVWRVYTLVGDLRGQARAAAALLQERPSDTTVPRLRPLAAAIHKDVAQLQGELAPIAPALRLLGWAPKYGVDLAAAGSLLDMAEALSGAAEQGLAAYPSLAPLLQDQQVSPQDLAVRLATARPQIAAARQSFERAAQARAAIPSADLSPELRDGLARIDALMPLLGAGLDLAAAADDTASALAPLEPLLAGDHALDDQLIRQLRGDGARYEQARLSTERAAQSWARIPLDSLPASARARLAPAGAALSLLQVVANLSSAGGQAASAVDPAIFDHSAAPQTHTALIAALDAGQPAIERARAALARAEQARAQIAPDALPPQMRGQLARIDGLLPAARATLDAAEVLPDLLGAHGPRRYLLLAQDVNELRATGGFIGGAGILAIDHGTATQFSLRNSPEIDDLTHHAYPPPPEPLRRYMGIQLWTFRDSNWSPDFPSAARQAIDSYRLGQGRDVDGVIAFDPAAVKLLLEATGPVQVEESGAPVSAATVEQYMLEQYNLNYPKNRKAFMETLGRAIVSKLSSPAGGVPLTGLARALRQALDQKHLLLYLAQPNAAEVLARHGWDGAVRPGDQDFLMVVDSNVGYNKVFPNISETISYTVDLTRPTLPSATLTVRHANRQPRARECSWRQRDKITRYEDYFVDCYWDYLRALVPADSRLVASQTNPTPGAWLFSGADEDGATTIAPGAADSLSLETLVVVPMGEERQTTFRYYLPAGTVAPAGDGWRYRLTIQKQPGLGGLPIAVEIRLPPHARLRQAVPAFTRQEGNDVVYALRLDRDKQIDLAFTTL